MLTIEFKELIHTLQMLSKAQAVQIKFLNERISKLERQMDKHCTEFDAHQEPIRWSK